MNTKKSSGLGSMVGIIAAFLILCVILAIPGFAGWILPLFVYKWIRRKRRERTMPLIEEKYDEIYAICEKGQKLLY